MLESLIHQAQTVRGIQPEQYPLAYTSLAHVFAEREREQYAAERTFMIFYDEHGERSEYSYGSFIYAARKAASVLVALGVQRGSRVATAAHNHPDTIVQYCAAWMLGACVVPLNMTEDDDRLRYVLENSGASVLLCREEYAERLAAIVPQPHSPRVVMVHTTVQSRPQHQDGNTALPPNDFHTLCEAAEALPIQPQSVSADDEALIVYTSGTTGNPKGVVLTQRNILADSEAIAAWHGIDPTQRMMCVLPVHHVNGTIVTHTTPMIAGASVVLNRKFQSEHFFERVRRERVHIVSVVPTLLAFLLEAHKTLPLTKTNSSTDDTDDTNHAPLRHIICGAGPLTCELARQFEERFHVPIIHGYGLSETTCYSCYLPTALSDAEHRHWMFDYGFPSIGVPIAPNEMAIHDEHGNALGAMERGEIVIRGVNVMKEYYQNPDANAKTFAFGWFRSGDEGFFKRDAHGQPYFFITGRLKELIIRGGVNLAPLEIDEVLAQAPGVRAGICVGFENDMYGEEVGALVIAQTPEVTAEAILQYCAEHLPFHKSPKVVVFTDTLPVTSTGKYQRNKVKHLFAAWKATQFRKP
jgi:long-chain acyl-CoA synthetase